MKINEVLGHDPNIDAEQAARNLKRRYPHAKDQQTAIIADIEKNERDSDAANAHQLEKMRDLDSRIKELESGGSSDTATDVITPITKAKATEAKATAGPDKCWDGYKKVGTKPGTGKNKGKTVNDCEKV